MDLCRTLDTGHPTRAVCGKEYTLMKIINEKTEEVMKSNAKTATIINKLQSTQRNTLSSIIDQEGGKSSTRVGIIIIQGGAE